MGKHSVQNKVAIVTGSSRGIGKAIAKALCTKGAKVILNGRSPEPLKKTEEEFRQLGFEVMAVQADVAKYADSERLVEETIKAFGKVDIVVNNAAISAEGSIEDTAPEVFEKMFRVNLLGMLYPAKAALPYLKQSKGSVVFTGSIAGLIGLPNYSAYSSTKMALTALVQSLKIELVGTGVHVGINYVGFAENEENKTIINKEGDLEIVPEREQFSRMPLELVAKHFVKGIERRKYKQTLSLLGKLMRLLQQYFPGIFERVMLMAHKRQRKSSTNN